MVHDGGLATSSSLLRRWQRGGQVQHHIIDPLTGKPAREYWRTVTVAAAGSVDANAASTAALVMGEAAADWLAQLGLPARLVHLDGSVLTVAGWPEEPGAPT